MSDPPPQHPRARTRRPHRHAAPPATPSAPAAAIALAPIATLAAALAPLTACERQPSPPATAPALTAPPPHASVDALSSREPLDQGASVQEASDRASSDQGSGQNHLSNPTASNPPPSDATSTDLIISDPKIANLRFSNLEFSDLKFLNLKLLDLRLPDPTPQPPHPPSPQPPFPQSLYPQSSYPKTPPPAPPTPNASTPLPPTTASALPAPQAPEPPAPPSIPPLSFFQQRCARCHGPYGEFFADPSRTLAEPQLAQAVHEMVAGPAQATLDGRSLDALIAFHRARRAGEPFLVLTTAGPVLRGEVTPGATVTARWPGATRTASVDGHAWSIPLPEGVDPLRVVVEARLGDNVVHLDPASSAWSHAEP